MYQDIRDLSNEFITKLDALVILSAIFNNRMGNKAKEAKNSINYLSVKKIIER